MINTMAKLTDKVTDTELAAARTALAAAKEGIILLKNDGVLPLKQKRIALYGEGAVFTFKGGTGSGEVNARHVTSIWEGFAKAGFEITTENWLKDYERQLKKEKEKYKKDMRKRTGICNFSSLMYLLSHPFSNPMGREILPEDLADSGNPCFFVISRQAGENADRRLEPGQLYLTETEIKNIEICCEHYQSVILVINAGGYVELEPLRKQNLKGILFFCQQGQEGGKALASIICGETTPSAHLTFSWPKKYTDIPYAMEFGTLDGKDLEDDYKEGIYVGYRYFDTFNQTVEFPFGYGLSYTDFSYETAEVSVKKNMVDVKISVRNIGEYKGKAVVQIYASCPKGRLEKEKKRLIAFAKTKELGPGEKEILIVPFQLKDMASFDEKKGEFVLEAGKYRLMLGEDVSRCREIAVLSLSEESTVSVHEHICPAKKAIRELSQKDRLQPDGGGRKEVFADEAEEKIPCFTINPQNIHTELYEYQDDRIESTLEEKKLLDCLSLKEKVVMVSGSGNDIALPKYHAFMVPGAGGYTTSRFEKKGIPAVPFADGPSGLRLFDVSVARGKKVRMVRPVMAFMDYLPLLARKILLGNPDKGQVLYQYTTAYPAGMAMASSWNVNLMERIGKSIQSEMEEFGVNVWLGPGINLYRNPLCGRTYEYYSEDPMLSGRMAAALIKGVQSKPGYISTVKHFCCNNREAKRRYASSNVRERALRELYLKSFEIAVREGKPGALMTSYNKVNEVYSAQNYDLVTKVLRNEWGFQGLVMTDWTTEADTIQAARCIHAGVNLFMQGAKYQHKQMLRDLKEHRYMSAAELERSAARVMRMIVNSELFQRK